MTSDLYQRLWGDQVRLQRAGKMSFENTAKGSREGKPFASLTGGLGDRVLIDDPHSTETAESDADRERTTRIFRESVPSRLNDAQRSAIIVIMQRLHEANVSGQILKLDLGYDHLMLPMEFEPDRRCRTSIGFVDPRKEEGELLFPERFPRETVERDKIPMGSYAVAGQFQQRPSPRDGGLFQRHDFEIVAAAPQVIEWVRGWDLAASTKKKSPWTAGVKMGRTASGQYVIADVVRDRVPPAGLERMVRNTAIQDGERVRISIPQDPGQAGKVQKAALAAALSGFDVRFSPETGEKVVRATPVSAQAEAGNVLIVKADWNDAFLDEVCAFPSSEFADQADAMSRAFAALQHQESYQPIAAPIIINARAN